MSLCEPEALLSLPDTGVPDSEIKTVSLLADIYDRELVATIGWAKQVKSVVVVETSLEL